MYVKIAANFVLLFFKEVNKRLNTAVDGLGGAQFSFPPVSAKEEVFDKTKLWSTKLC